MLEHADARTGPLALGSLNPAQAKRTTSSRRSRDGRRLGPFTASRMTLAPRHNRSDRAPEKRALRVPCLRPADVSHGGNDFRGRASRCGSGFGRWGASPPPAGRQRRGAAASTPATQVPDRLGPAAGDWPFGRPPVGQTIGPAARSTGSPALPETAPWRGKTPCTAPSKGSAGA